MNNHNILLSSLLFTLAACGASEPKDPAPEAAAGPTAADAKVFVDQVNSDLYNLYVEGAKAAWKYQTDLTDENMAGQTKAQEAEMAYMAKAVADSTQFSGVEGMDAATARALMLLRNGQTLPAPSGAEGRSELAQVTADLEGMYGKGKYCPDPEKPDTCYSLGDLEDILAEHKSYDDQLMAWKGWRTVSPAMRPKYERFAALGNQGAMEIGFKDLGQLWRSGYDMDPNDFDAEVERLWQQVKPLYEQLHCHVRAKLSEHYGADKVSPDGKIPAHLLGNMWAQSWENLYDLMIPYPSEPSLDITGGLVENGFDEMKMVKTAESFFTSMGLDPLPQTFWERSQFVKPEDRDVVCHASAWNVELKDDLRIKMCIKVNADNFQTIHHELGHNYYYHYYYNLPVLFQRGANDGFHEGIGDTLALSITPQYLQQIGVLKNVSPSKEAQVNKQFQDALAKIAFLPFGRMIDKWRWQVFSGETAPEAYNADWWTLRETYQGIEAPVERTEADFDPGAKYHIPANTPYMRYFLAHILQFQFHKALCDVSGHEGPLHTCSIYGSKEAGEKMQAMLAMGAAKPWPDALEAIAGTRQMDAQPLLDYFGPLSEYLEEQNAGRTCGW